jgi:hypothetical protein
MKRAAAKSSWEGQGRPLIVISQKEKGHWLAQS